MLYWKNISTKLIAQVIEERRIRAMPFFYHTNSSTAQEDESAIFAIWQPSSLVQYAPSWAQSVEEAVLEKSNDFGDI